MVNLNTTPTRIAFQTSSAQIGSQEPFLQLLDVTLGALTAFRNGRHLLDGTTAAKAELAKHAVTALGIKDIAKNFDDGRRLSIWNVIPKKRGPKG